MIQPTMNCPKCRKEYEDFDGFGVIYCESCGYCRHVSKTNDQCDYCGRPENVPPVSEQNRMIAEMNERIALESSLEALRLRHQLRRLLKYARALKAYSDSQAELIESLMR